METVLFILLGVVIGAIPAAIVTFFVLTSSANSKVRAADVQARRTIDEAEAKRRELVLEAKDEALRARDELEREHQQRRKEVDRLERRLQQKEEQVDRRIESLDRREKKVQTSEREIEDARSQLDEMEQARRIELERVAQLTLEEARSQVLQQAETEMRDIMNRQVREIEQADKARGKPTRTTHPCYYNPTRIIRLCRGKYRVRRAVAERRHEGTHHRT